MDFFKSCACRVCKIICSHPAKRCTKCRTVSYCCKEHQIKDWKNHKQLCKIIANEHEYVPYNVKNAFELNAYIQERGNSWQWQLGRQLELVEMQMLMYPRICAVCFAREPIGNCSCRECAKQHSLFDCPECQSVFYCSKEHQQLHEVEHQKYCEELKLSLHLQYYVHNNEPDPDCIDSKGFSPDFTSMPESKQTFLDLFTRSSNKLHLVMNCDKVLSGLTILYSLEKAGLVIGRKLNKSSLNIHCVGAANEMMLFWHKIVEIFFHWITNLEHFHIEFIGPELIECPFDFETLKTFFCDNCQHRTITTSAGFHFDLYHNVYSKLVKPDIVVALNSGTHEFYGEEDDTWKESLNIMLENPDTPLVLTAYTFGEIQKDSEVVLKEVVGSKVVYGPVENPYSDFTPLPDCDYENEVVYHVNSYIMILKK